MEGQRMRALLSAEEDRLGSNCPRKVKEHI